MISADREKSLSEVCKGILLKTVENSSKSDQLSIRVFRALNFELDLHSRIDTMSDNLIMAIEEQVKKFEGRRLSDNVYELVPEPDPDVELVFFHGLLREGTDPKHAFWRTWKMRDSEECWPETLLPKLLSDGHEGYYRVRVLSVTYENRPHLSSTHGAGNGASDDYLIVENLYQELIVQAGVGQKNGVPVFLLGQYLGGILIKVFVMEVENQEAIARDTTEKAKYGKFLENLKSVSFYSTPHHGAEAFEKLAAKLDANDTNQMLRLMNVLQSETSRINANFQNYRQRRGVGCQQRPRFITHGIHAAWATVEGGYNIQVVPEGSARSDVDSFVTVQANHFTVCQPAGQWAVQVTQLVHEIKEVLSACKSERSNPWPGGARS